MRDEFESPIKTIYEDSYITVRKNPSGEIFITNNKDKDAEIRIGPDGTGLIATTSRGRMSPWMVNGLQAFSVRGR